MTIKHITDKYSESNYSIMDEKTLLSVKEAIDQQIKKVERIIDKRATAGQHFDDFLQEEKSRLYGMLQVYWLVGGEGYDNFRNS